MRGAATSAAAAVAGCSAVAVVAAAVAVAGRTVAVAGRAAAAVATVRTGDAVVGRAAAAVVGRAAVLLGETDPTRAAVAVVVGVTGRAAVAAVVAVATAGRAAVELGDKLPKLQSTGPSGEPPRRPMSTEAGIRLQKASSAGLSNDLLRAPENDLGAVHLGAGVPCIQLLSTELRCEPSKPSGADLRSGPPMASSAKSGSKASIVPPGPVSAVPSDEQLLKVSSADLDGTEAGRELQMSTRAEASCETPRP